MSLASLRQAPLAAPLALMVAMVSIQSGASLARSLFDTIGPLGVTCFRLALAALILLIVFRPWRSGRPHWRGVLMYGLCLGGMNGLFYLAIARIPLGVGVALEYVGPLMVALLASRRARDLIWVALAAAGMVCLLPVASFSAPLDPLGAFLALAAGGCWAGYIVFGKKAAAGMKGGDLVALGMCVGALMMAPAGIASGQLWQVTWQLLPLLLAVAMLSSVVPYSLEMMALRQMNARSFSIFMSLEPAIAALAGVVWLAQDLTALQWGAIAMIMAASIGNAALSRPPKPAPELTP